MKKMEFRMYSLVMYNLSGIQKGIQSGHANIEYARAYGEDPDFQNWADNHKTVILLDGGGSIEMEDICNQLSEHDIPYAEFIEPDLNNSISAVSFVVPERVYGEEATYYFAQEGMSRLFRRGDVEPVGFAHNNTWLAWFIKQFNLARN